MNSAVWHGDPKRLVFTLSRYKFVAKMLSGKNSVAEIGCGDGFGARIVKQEFDLVISLGTFHNLRLPELKIALLEMERVGKQAYLMLESYRNERELFNLQCWALTAESFFDKDEWIWLYNNFGYTGDYEFIYFE